MAKQRRQSSYWNEDFLVVVYYEGKMKIFSVSEEMSVFEDLSISFSCNAIILALVVRGAIGLLLKYWCPSYIWVGFCEANFLKNLFRRPICSRVESWNLVARFRRIWNLVIDDCFPSFGRLWCLWLLLSFKDDFCKCFFIRVTPTAYFC